MSIVQHGKGDQKTICMKKERYHSTHQKGRHEILSLHAEYRVMLAVFARLPPNLHMAKHNIEESDATESKDL